MVTMQDIASKVGISRSAVSTALNNSKSSIRVSAGVREKVLSTAKDMGYIPNELARSVARGKSNVVAFVVSSLKMDYISEILEGLLYEAQKQSYVLKIFQLSDELSYEKIFDLCVSHKIAGVIICHFSGDFKFINSLKKENIPVALFAGNGNYSGLLECHTDDKRGYIEAISHLSSLGHKRIAMISGDEMNFYSQNRVDAFKCAMLKYDLTFDGGMVKFAEDWSVDKVEVATEELLSLPIMQRPTAICCASDILAMGVLRTSHRMNLRIPQDLSVIGLANMYISELSDPALTTINQADFEASREMFRELLNLIHTKKRKELTVYSKMNLVVRDSTGAVKI